MILRKPYAFLIKHFRAIHLIMIACISYIVFKNWKIFSFLGDYISGKDVFSVYEDISGKYVGTFLIVVVALLIIASAVILYLMKHKKKPSFFYTFMVITYSVILVSFLYGSSFIYNIQFTTPDLRFTKIIRDIFLIETVIQIPMLIISFVRTIGFDIKKFDFKKDLLELDVSDEDNAEFEFELNLDTEDIRAKVRKRIRFFKYYYKENKVVFFTLGICLVVVFSIFITRYMLSIEKVYKEEEIFSTRSLDVSVLDSYKTIYDYKGNEVSDKYFYVILKLRYKNRSNSNVSLNLDNARLSYTEVYNTAPTTLMYNKFSEFGVPYYSQVIHAGEIRDFMLVYQIDKEYYDGEFRLKYLYDIAVVNNQPEYKYHIVSLNPQEFGEQKKVDTKKLQEELTFNDSVLGNTKITIDSIDLSNRYTYNVIRCKNSECNKYTNFLTPSTNKNYELTLMRINYSLSYDERLGKGFSISNFIARYGSIRFVINDKEYNSKIDLFDITPYPTDNYVYLEVREKVNKAEKIYLDFTIRDKVYTYVIKDEAKEEIGK